MRNDEEKKNSGGEELIPILEDDDSNANASQDAVVNFKGAVDDDIFDDEIGTSKNSETIEAEFAKAAKDGTLYEKYSEYLKRNEERLKNPNLSSLKDGIKRQIADLKKAYCDAAGLTKKICPKCGKIHEKDAKFSTCHALPVYVAGQCCSCGAYLSSAQGYSAINCCPKCGAELAEPQKKIINEILVKTLAKTKYVCSKCGKVYDSAIRHCQDCGSKILTMQCGKCGEVLRQNEEGIFDKYCPVCGMLNPAEVEKINQKKKEQLQPEDTEDKKGIGKGTIAVLCIALAVGYAVWKGNDSSSVPGKNVPTTTAQADNSASLQAQLEAEKSAREESDRKQREAEAAKEEEERKRKEAEAKAAADAAARAEAEQALKKQQEEVVGERQENVKEEETNRQVSIQTLATTMSSTAREYKVGDKITFGSYPFYEDGREKPIDWKILDIDANGNALLISDYALDNVSYNENNVNITWENSTIREWLNNDFLNNDFLNKAFSPEQRRKIISSRITNKDNAKYNTRGGNVTTDKLFLLSIEEAEKYFKDDESRIAYPTPYAKSKKSVNGNLSVSSSNVSTDRGGSCWWWLRSPGTYQDTAASVNYVGDVSSRGFNVSDDSVAVRVALWLDLKNL